MGAAEAEPSTPPSRPAPGLEGEPLGPGRRAGAREEPHSMAVEGIGVLCFSYGSNMSLARLRARVPSARVVAVAALPGHRLRFHKIGMDGSAKCDAEWTGRKGDRVLGMVFEIPDGEKPILDRNEGLGAGYDEKRVEVVTAEGARITAQVYVATAIDPSRKPFRWYREHVLAGAREHDLPADYVARIEAVEAVEDRDGARRERELMVHRSGQERRGGGGDGAASCAGVAQSG